MGQKQILFEKKLHSNNPFGSFFDVFVFVAIFLLFLGASMLASGYDYINQDAVIYIVAGAFAGQVVNILKQRPMSGEISNANKPEFIDRLEKLGYRSDSTESPYFYIKLAPRWARWDSDIVKIIKLNDQKFKIIAPVTVFKRL